MSPAPETPEQEGTGASPGPGENRATAAAHPARAARRVVISSVTGRPIPWHDPETPSPTGPAAQRRRPILPDRVEEDSLEAGVDESNDARIAGDVPPHWGRGR